MRRTASIALLVIFGGGARYVDELLVQTGEVNLAPGGGLTHHNPSRRAYEEVREESPGQNCP